MGSGDFDPMNWVSGGHGVGFLRREICAEFLRELCKKISKIRFLNNSLSYENSFDVFEFLMFLSSLEVPLNILNLVLKKVIFRKREQKALCTFFYGPRKLKFLDPLY